MRLSQHAIPKYYLSATNTFIRNIWLLQFCFSKTLTDKVDIEVKLMWAVNVTAAGYLEAHCLACQ